MNRASYTPGPWRVEQIDSLTPWTDALSIATPDGSHVAHTTRGFEGALLPSGEHDETSCAWANARLIAAAPNLLAALEDALAFIKGDISGPAQRAGILRDGERAIRMALEGG